MAKNKLVKNITTDDLAVIINKGFQGQMDYMEKKFGEVAGEISTIKKDVKDIKNEIVLVDALGKRVDYIENVLNISALPAKKN